MQHTLKTCYLFLKKRVSLGEMGSTGTQKNPAFKHGGHILLIFLLEELLICTSSVGMTFKD